MALPFFIESRGLFKKIKIKMMSRKSSPAEQSGLVSKRKNKKAQGNKNRSR